jgi:nicotinamidase-related amidase
MSSTTAKTLRQWAGLARPTVLAQAGTALVIIDIQQDYFRDKLVIPDGKIAVENAARLLAWARRRGLTVVHIQQQAMKPGSPLFAPDSSGIEFHPAVAPAAGEWIVVKHFPSSFTQTDLQNKLRERNIDTLILCGLMTHMCVDSTARGALEYGYRVIVVHDACASRDLPGLDGNTAIPHSTIHTVTLAALADRFADIMTVNEITELPLK